MATLQKGISAIRIYDGNNEPMMVVDITDSSRRVREVMKEDSLKIVWESSEYTRLPAGCHVHYGTNISDKDNPAFYLLNPYEPTRKAEDCYTYEPKFHARQDMWQKYPCCVYTYGDGGKIKGRELEWSFLGTPEDALSMVEQSVLNETGQRLEASVIGSVRERGSSAVDISGQSTPIFEVLGKIAEALDTEWRYDEENNRIVLGEFRLDSKDYPVLQLRVGTDCGNPQVSQNKEDYFTRFYVFGSDRNITQQQVTEITSSAVKKRLPLDSAKYPDGFIDLDITSDPRLEGDSENGWALPDGVVYEPRQRDKSLVFPKGLYFDEVYPSTKFYVSKIYVNGKDGKQQLVDENGNVVGDTYYVAVSTERDGAVWNGYRLADVLPGETLQMYFTSGLLNGRQYDLSAHPNYDGTDTYFYLTPDKNGALTTPNRNMAPKVGDEVTFFGYNFGQIGINDAKARLEKTAIKYLKELVQSNMTYTIKGNAVAFERYSKRDVRYSMMPLGQQVVIDHGKGDVSEVLRVTKVESALDIPSEMTITASAKTEPKGTLTSLTDTVELNRRTEEKKIEDYKQQLIRYSQRSMTQVYETMQQVNNYFSGEMQSIQAMQQVTGSESLQFVFSDNIDFDPLRNPVCWYDNTAVPPCFRVKMYEDDSLYFYVKHMTLGITAISSAAATDKARLVWRLTNQRAAWQNPDMGMAYLECSKTFVDGIGEARLLITDQKMDINGDAFYYLLLGFINKPNERGERSFAQMYSYTEILPGRITTDRIVSQDGGTYFDLANGEIGGKINFRDSVMTETILIKDGEVDAEGKPYYIGGISGEPNLPTIWTGIDPHITDTEEVRRAAMEDELPVKLTHEGYGSNIGCLRVVDDERVDVRNADNGLVRISTKSINAENALLSPVSVPDVRKTARALETGFTASVPERRTTIEEVFDEFPVSATGDRNFTLTMDPSPVVSVRVTCWFSDKATRECRMSASYTLLVAMEYKAGNGEWVRLKSWSSTCTMNKTVTKKKLGEERDVTLDIRDATGGISGEKMRVRLVVSQIFRFSSQYDDGKSSVEFSVAGMMGQRTYKFTNRVRANILAGGGYTCALDGNNYFKLYPNGSGRLTAGLRAIPELVSLDLTDGKGYVRLRKWGFLVYCTLDLYDSNRASTILTLPSGYRPVRECVIPMCFETGTDRSGRFIGCVSYNAEGALSWYSHPKETPYYGYATAMWVSVD